METVQFIVLLLVSVTYITKSFTVFRYVQSTLDTPVIRIALGKMERLSLPLIAYGNHNPSNGYDDSYPQWNSFSLRPRTSRSAKMRATLTAK